MCKETIGICLPLDELRSIENDNLAYASGISSSPEDPTSVEIEFESSMPLRDAGKPIETYKADTVECVMQTSGTHSSANTAPACEAVLTRYYGDRYEGPEEGKRSANPTGHFSLKS